MKIESTKTSDIRKTGKTKAKSSTSGSLFSAHLAAAEEEMSAPAAVSGPSGVSSVDAIFAAQIVEDSTAQHNKKAKRHGEDMLGHLESVRIGLLSGSIPKDQLLRLAQLSRQRPDKAVDARLADILAEIDIRVQVELAKLAHIA